MKGEWNTACRGRKGKKQSEKRETIAEEVGSSGRERSISQVWFISEY